MSRQRETYFYGGGVEIESEEDVSESPPESGSGRASPAPALAAEDRKRDKVNRNGCEYRHNECCWLLWRYKINDAIITTYCYNTHTFGYFIQPPLFLPYVM